LQQEIITPLDIGVPAHGSVNQDRWVFYKFTIPANKGFLINVQHGAGVDKIHDVDVYVRKAPFVPDRTTYDYKDTSFTTNITIDGTAEPTETQYIVGVFGFRGQSTPFIITVVYSNGCPANCNGRGTCISNACYCIYGFSGDVCQYAVQSVILEQTYSAIVNFGTWIYYSVDVFVANNLIVNVAQNSGDVDLYIRYQSVPDFLNYQYFDFTPSQQFNISIVQPYLGTWYLGFYGFSTTSFSFNVSEVRSCPMKCSLHGTCVGTYCRCDPNYVGVTCEEGRYSLTLKQSVHGYVAENDWNFYSYIANSDNPFQIIANHSINSNCDIYVLDGSKPTRFIYLYRNITSLPISTLVVYTPDFSTWWIGIYGTTSCEYDMFIDNYSPATSACGVCINGICNKDNVCQCNQGWIGQTCNERTNFLQNGVKSDIKEIGNGGWIYFEINVVDSSQLIVVLQEKTTAGLVWMFIAKETYPTLASYEASDNNSATSAHRISMEFTIPKSQKFIIGVYGSPFIVQQKVTFDLVAYYPPF